MTARFVFNSHKKLSQQLRKDEQTNYDTKLLLVSDERKQKFFGKRKPVALNH